MSRKISYAFRDDGVYAIENGKVIAHADTLEHLSLTSEDIHALETVTEHAKQENPGLAGPGGHSADDDVAYDGVYSKQKVATHIVTPSGLKGKIMGKVVPGLWGDEVTVRFENGHIAKLQVSDVELSSDGSAKTAKTIEASADKVAWLREKLAETPEGDELSLKARIADLREIQEIATELASRPRTASAELVELDSIRAEAAYESAEAKDALEYLADAEPFAPPAHFASHVAEQATIGGFGDGQWLSSVYDDMVREADATDFDQLLNEGPEVFIADLDQNILADQGTTAQLATSFIESKVAAARPEVREKYSELWLERVEQVRRDTYASRRVTIAKDASAEADLYENLPDECLFS
jgi:hypothetical protein